MKNFLKLALTSFLLFNLTSCTKTDVKKSRYSEADWNQSLGDNQKAIEIFATNSIKGNLTPQPVYFSPDELSPVSFGGAPLLLAYNKISKERSKSSLWLDLGDSYDSLSGPIHQGITSYFFSEMKYDAIAYTEKELSIIGLNSSPVQLPFIISNMIDLSTAQTFKNDLISPWKIITKDGIKIGVISVTNYKFIKQESSEKTKGLFFEDMVLSILRAKKEFVKNKVDLSILLANIDSGCHMSHDEELTCPNQGDDLKKLLSRIPPDTIDLALASPNRIAFGRINNIPVMMVAGQGKWLARIRAIFDQSKLANIQLLSPIRVCDKFFHETNDCHFPLSGEEDESERLTMLRKSKNEIKPAKFWGHEIIEDKKIEQSFQLIRTQGIQAPENN